MPLDTGGLIAASRTFTAALLAPRDDDQRDVAKICMGLLGVVGLLVKNDQASKAIVALQLRQMANEMENSAPPLLTCSFPGAGLDWSARLTGGDSLASSSWIAPDGITADRASHTGSLAICWLSGGTAGKSYDILNRVVTVNGRRYDQSVRIRIKTK
jgi:hypothetical protein